MNISEFKIYRDQRISQLRDAYSNDLDQNSYDPLTRELWFELRRNWIFHSDLVRDYAFEKNTEKLINCWRSIIENSRYSAEHEGIGLNINLPQEYILEILSSSELDEEMYLLTEHLKKHPNYKP